MDDLLTINPICRIGNDMYAIHVEQHNQIMLVARFYIEPDSDLMSPYYEIIRYVDYCPLCGFTYRNSP
jgi:hypothetical protein